LWRRQYPTPIQKIAKEGIRFSVGELATMMDHRFTYSAVFQCEIVNRKVTSFSIPVTRKPGMRILLISDTHIGGTRQPVASSKRLFITALNSVIQSEKATHVIHLGDLIDCEVAAPEAHLADVLSQLAALPVPIWLIGGNHDREWITPAAGSRGPNLTIAPDLALLLDIPPSAPGQKDGQRIFLAHDLANNYRVRDQFAFSFVHWIKEAAAPEINARDDWLITGHCHTQFLSAACKIGSVGQFSPEIDTFEYTMLTIDDVVTLVMKSSY
jgi:predicted phosphodiesterase